MALTKQVSGEVASDVQRRGRQYYAKGAVSILDGDHWSVHALVQGTEQYHVNLTRGKKRLKIWCTCPYYCDRAEPCKHIWATVLAAEARGFLSGSGGAGRLRMVDDEEAYEAWEEQNGSARDPDEWDDEGVEEWDEWNGPADYRSGFYSYGQPSSKQRARKRAKTRPRPPNWKKRLDGLRGEMQREE